jgi:hypothetical protein
MNLENIKLAFGGTFTSSSDGYNGAVLITDFKGFPLEFRYTDPIIPTKIQQVLYGKGLERYIKIDVILDSLIKAMSSKTQLLIVQDEDMLDYKSDNIAIVRLSPTKTQPLPQQGELSQVKKCEYLLQTGHASSPVRLQFSQDYNCESEQFDNIVQMLKESGNFMDIDEPLARVYKTLELICSQDV